MANILRNKPCHVALSGGRRFRVEWEDNGGLTRDRHFDSYRAAGRFAVKIETRLFIEALQDFNAIAKDQSQRDQRGATDDRDPAH
jgi:hypothetical protein